MVMPKVIVFIPVRMDSKRFPGKCMHKIGKFPLACWTYTQTRMSGYVSMVITPDKEVRDDLLEYRKIPCLLTSNNPRNGTERCAEALSNPLFSSMKDEDIVIDVQGDMMKFDTSCIQDLVHLLSIGKAEYVTTFTKLPEGSLSNLNRVKCTVASDDGSILWVDNFSRSSIPDRENYLHIGIYGYTKKALYRYREWKMTENEQITKLEQMRIIDNGYRIAGTVSDVPPVTVDCPADIYLAEKEAKKIYG